MRDDRKLCDRLSAIVGMTTYKFRHRSSQWLSPSLQFAARSNTVGSNYLVNSERSLIGSAIRTGQLNLIPDFQAVDCQIFYDFISGR